MKIPLILKLKRKRQKDIAHAQDILVEKFYEFFPDGIIHGGTAIWRCYNGNRFSEDLDVYIKKDEKVIKNFFNYLEKIGFKINKKRIKERSVYSELVFNEVYVRFEATFQRKKGVVKNYETAGGFFINVYTLPPEELVLEKIDTYRKRRKIRDLYDIFFLLEYCNIDFVRAEIKDFANKFEKPVDEENLSTIIIIGAVPKSEQLLEEIRRWGE